MGTHADAQVAILRAQWKLSEPDKPSGVASQGWVYFIGAPFWPVVKIGWALNPNRRLDAIRLLAPFPLHLLTGLPGTTKDEKRIHSRFAALRTHGEWFRFEGPLIDYFDEVKAANGTAPWPPP